MKTLFTALLVLVIAAGAVAQDRMGVSAYEDAEMDFINIVQNVPFNFYVCLFDPSSASIGGYECGFEFSNPMLPIILDVGGPNGWTNFGDNTNHLVGYTTPLPASPITVLCTYTCMAISAPYETLLLMGPANPSSFGGEGPGYSDGANPDILVLCSVPADGVVGTISTEVLATEARSFSGVKALFN